MTLMKLNRWARRSTVVRALYQGKPIVLVHRLLSAVGMPAVLGKELYDLSRLHDREPVVPPSRTLKERVLFVTPRNFRTHATFQIGVAQALTVRGAECAVATCGSVMPVCEVTWAEKESFPRCPRCITYIRELTSLAGIHCYNLADYIDSAVQAKIASEVDSLTFEQLKGYVWNDLPLGVYAVPATRWRLRAHDIGKHPDGLAVMAGFIRGGAVWASCMEKLLASFDPDVLVMLNGLFMEER
ncbi:MAG: hypothetical protein HY581_11945, partial [Nitrospirae bacterium]|nr:hypothetical protein [Nitrospirota bacterium]